MFIQGSFNRKQENMKTRDIYIFSGSIYIYNLIILIKSSFPE